MAVCVCARVWGGATDYISEIALNERNHKNLKVLSVLETKCVGKQSGLPLHIVLFDHANIFFVHCSIAYPAVSCVHLCMRSLHILQAT